MKKKSVLIIDGFEEPNAFSENCIAALDPILKKENDAVFVIALREKKLAHCVGCFGCWVKTPGLCRFNDDQTQINKEFIQSDTVILLTPVSFGGYSSLLKRAIDRIIPLGHPNMGLYKKETHHVPRYKRYPRLITIGHKENATREEIKTFRLLTARNALNFHAPSWASTLITGNQKAALGRELSDLCTQKDAVPQRSELLSLMQYDKNTTNPTAIPGNALLVIGSPKLNASNSESLGTFTLNRLEAAGWTGRTIRLDTGCFKDQKRDAFLAAVKESNLVILAFPLYVDALPYLVTRALECFLERRAELRLADKRLAVIINNGFPESYQNAPAISMCKSFVREAGMAYAGHLALGAGEGLINEQAIKAKDRSGPPIQHVEHALTDAAEALSNGRCIPDDCQTRLDKSPIPFFPFGLWRRVFIYMAGRHWKKWSREYGLKVKDLSATPYIRS